MRTATLIATTLGGLSLAMPSQAQQAAPVGVAPAAPVTVTRGAPMPGVQHVRHAPQRPGGWQPTRPPHGGWKPATSRPGNWQPARPGRWGQRIDGRWYAGWKAPGGWSAYRRPVRGWTLPTYWIGGGFWINDWSSWGLSRPAAGYDWVRYYDDAVLIDRRGKVWDSVSGLDWDRDGHGYDYDDGYVADREDYDRGYGADYDAPGYDDPDYDREVRVRHYDRREYRDRYDDRDGYDGYDGYRRHARRPLVCVANCYTQGHYYGAPATTTVVIQSAPVVTKTVVTEEVVYSSPRRVVRRVPSKKLYRAPVKGKNCYCR